MHARRTTLTLLPLVVVGLALTGCSSDSGEPGTAPAASETVEAPASPEPEATPTVAPALTQAEVDALLLTAAEAPAGWTPLAASGNSEDTFAGTMANGVGADPFGSTEDDGSTYDPAACAGIMNDLGEPSDGIGAGTTGVAMFSSPDTNQILVQLVQSAEGAEQGYLAVPASYDAALGQCAAFTSTDTDGVVSQTTLTGLDLPAVGDAVGGARTVTSASTGGMTFSMSTDTASISSGSTLVTVVVIGFGGLDETVVATAVQAVGAKLPAA